MEIRPAARGAGITVGGEKGSGGAPCSDVSGLSVGIANQFYFDGQCHLRHALLRREYFAIALESESQTGAIREGQPVFLGLKEEFGAAGREHRVEGNDFDAIALQQSGNGPDCLLAFEGFLQNLGVVDGGDDGFCKDAQHQVSPRLGIQDGDERRSVKYDASHARARHGGPR